MLIWRFLAVLVIGLWLAAPVVPRAVAAENASQLDELFADLKVAKDVTEGRAIEARIVAIWLDSGDAEIDRMMGWAIAAMNANSFALALNYLDTIVVTRPDYVEGWNKRATVYYITGDAEHSIADIEKTLALEPRHFGALAGLGLIKERQGKYAEALDAFHRALAINPNLEDIKAEVFMVEDKLGKKT